MEPRVDMNNSYANYLSDCDKESSLEIVKEYISKERPENGCEDGTEYLQNFIRMSYILKECQDVNEISEYAAIIEKLLCK